MLKYDLNLKSKLKTPLNAQIHAESQVVCLMLEIPFLIS